MSPTLLLLIVALILFLAASAGFAPRFHLGWLGMALLTVAALLGGGHLPL